MNALPHPAKRPDPSRLGTLLLLGLATSTSACGALTREEAADALEEIKLSSQAQALTTESVELTTNFTIGDAVQSAAEQLRSFVETELPCAEVHLELRGDEGTDGSATLRIEYGAKDGDCRFRGREFSGRHIVNIAKNERELVQVDHSWESLSNGVVSLDGTASVEWDFESRSRRVVHDARWTRLRDGRTGEGSGDRVQRALDGDITLGFGVDGTRRWVGERGTWDLRIDGVEMRWVDPVPQAGTYTLDTPFDKRVSAHFERTSERAIRVTIEGPRRSFDFSVVSLADGGETTEETGSKEELDQAQGDAAPAE